MKTDPETKPNSIGSDFVFWDDMWNAPPEDNSDDC